MYVYQILYLPDTNLGEGVPKKVASVVSVKMFLAPFAMAAKKALPVALVYIPPLLIQGVVAVLIALMWNSPLLSNLSARPGFSLVNLGFLFSKANEFKINISFR